MDAVRRETAWRVLLSKCQKSLGRGEECDLFLLMACVVSVNAESIPLWELSMGVRGCD